MLEYVIVGSLAGGSVAVAIVLLRRVIQNNAAKKAARAEHAHAEPGAPHARQHGGASGDASARLSDNKRSGGY